MDPFTLHHISRGISLIRLSERKPDENDLVSDPALWEELYRANRDEVLEKCGASCPAARRFEPDLEQDEEEETDQDSDDRTIFPTLNPNRKAP